MSPFEKGLVTVAGIGSAGLIYWLVFQQDVAVTGPGVETAALPANESASTATETQPVDDTDTAVTEETPASDVAPEDESDVAEAPEDAPAVEAEPEVDVTEATPQPTEAPETDVASESTEDEETATAEATPQPEENEEPSTPKSEATFDVVRVEPGGAALIAGRSVPGAAIELFMNGATVAKSVSDQTGGFVIFADLGASEKPRVLTMTETWADGTTVEAPASVILAPIPALSLAELDGESPEAEEAADDTTVALSEETASEPEEAVSAVEDVTTASAADDATATEDVAAATQSAAEEADDAGASSEDITVATDEGATAVEEAASAAEETAEDTAAAVVAPIDETLETEPGSDTVAVATPEPAAPVQEPATPQAPAVLIADEDGVRVLQNPGDQPVAMTNVSIDTISYDDAGEVALSGRAIGTSAVRIYLNNKQLTDADIGEDGQWRADLPEIDTGTYTLRVDELSETGEVISRAETPFRREAVEAIQALDKNLNDGPEIAPVSLITVQPGNTLWGIADEKYGEGFLFVRVFEANADRIRNPDLIYPGQIFSVPD